jgi:hypothetical protein
VAHGRTTDDLLTPGRPVRDPHGVQIGCVGLQRPSRIERLSRTELAYLADGCQRQASRDADAALASGNPGHLGHMMAKRMLELAAKLKRLAGQ